MARQTFLLKNRLVCAGGVCLLCVLGLVWAAERACAQPKARGAAAQTAAEVPQGTPLSWAEDATRNEIKAIESSDVVPLQCRQRKVTAKGSTTREIIATRDGNVARLMERDGQPLTAEEDADEKARLNDLLSSPDEFLRHHRRDNDLRESVVKLVGMMPQAMIYSYAPGQPQPKGAEGEQVVLDFHPNPGFHPPTMLAEALTGLEGRVWVDAKSHYLTRIEARVLHPVDMGFGVVAKIYPGGTLEMEQRQVDGGHWVYTHVEEHLTARLLLVKNYPENTVIDSWDFRVLPALLSYQDGIRELLSMPVQVR